MTATKTTIDWAPYPDSPQQMAIQSPAAVVGYGGAGGGGKMLDLATMIPTPNGWKTMGELVAGDELFDENGYVCRVTIAHPVEMKPVSYRLTFDDGSQVDACADHLWLTFDTSEMAALTRLDPEWRAARRARRPSTAGTLKSDVFRQAISARNASRLQEYKSPPTGTVRSTAEIAATLHPKRGRANHAVPVAKPLELPQIALPLDPYCLGAWLGDGSACNSQFTGVDPEIWQNFEACGFEVRHYSHKQHCIVGLQTVLKSMCVLGNKHVPSLYLRASKEQRLALLQGLMDTDGTVTDGGSVEFTNTNKRLAEAVLELICSLGWKARMVEGRSVYRTKDGEVKDCGPKFDIKWTPSEYVFRLTRKREKQKLATRRTTKFRYIVGCDPIDPKPMRCITVDSPSHLYLCGREMIPTHNTDCVLGTAASYHQKADIFRREYPQLDDLIERSHEILDEVAHYNKSTRVWTGRWKSPDGKMKRRRIRFGAVQRFDDLLKKWKGRTRDFLGIDEATEWPEQMIRFLMGWLRSPDADQRTRVILTFNPPTSAEGMWVISFFAPWLDPKHPNPAKAGEVRWFARIGDKDVEVADGTPIPELDGNGVPVFKKDGAPRFIYPQSRTFIPALLEDNPVLAATDYDQTLSMLPEPLRSQLRNGDFTAGIADDAWQCIPTAWVEAAMARGRVTGRPRLADGTFAPLSCLGVDPSRGGAAAFAIAPRYENWFAPVVTHHGITTSDGPKGAILVMEEWGLGATINIDLTGVGTSVYDSLVERVLLMERETSGKITMQVTPVNGAAGCKQRDRSGKYRLVNVRAAMWWTLREALDPVHGDNLCLPDDAELKADLCAPRYQITAQGIMIEPKYSQPGVATKSVSQRLGRSPDKGDAVCLANWLRGVEYFAV